MSEEDLARVPRLASGCDPTALELSPAEGFLLSRIDGQTSWKLLREIGGITPGEVDLCVEDWLMRGYIDIDGRPPRVKRRESAIPQPPKPKQNVAPGAIDESLIDDTLDLDEELQREILEVERKLECDYFSLLGVGRDADPKEIKRVYFSLSKRFHPDRYFRKNVGEYGDRLHRVFKAISEAYDLLSDPASRKEIEAALADQRRLVESFSDPGDSSGGKQSKRRVLTPIERLRQRMPFKMPEGLRDEKAARGEELFKAAQQSERMQRYSEAAANLRLAVAFDPFNREYKRALGAAQARIAYERIGEILGEGECGLSESEKSEARRLAEEVILHRPKDHATLDLAARVYVELGDPERAEEYCKRALEAAPDTGAYHRTMAMVHELRGNKGHAVSELKKALDLDSGDGKARKMLQALRSSSRRT
ncbi:MAG: DnaJ domain-containing protein [bacterium]|nr:DnaJ domain-containing protein [bacterium]